MSELFEFLSSHDDGFKSKARLTSLYSDFGRLQSSNPEGYAANSAAWRAALERASRAGFTADGDTLILGTGDDLLQRLENDELGRPLSLGSVISEAVQDGALIPLQDYMDATHSIYKKSWITIPTVSAVARWVLQQAGFGGGAGALPKAKFVVLKNVEEASQKILKQVADQAHTPTSLVYSLDTFMEAFGEARQDAPALTKSDASVVLRHLSRDKSAAMIAEAADGKTVVKFGAPSSRAPPSPVTQHDITVASLQSLTRKLSVQADALAARITGLDKTARAELAANHRDRALTALRRKKALEMTLKKRHDSIDQVEHVLMSIDEAAGQLEMVSAMEASSKVLRDVNKRVGGVERVDAVMESLRDSMADVDEVSRVMAESGAEQVDESEVDDELTALESESKRAREKEQGKEQGARESEMLESAPDVPEGIGAGTVDTPAKGLEKQLHELTLRE